MTRFLLVCLGSAAGGGARYLLSGWLLGVLGPAFPWGTLAVNVLGSFLVAFVMYAGVEAAALSPDARIALAAGVLGGFTTFSTFGYETMKYLQDGAVWLAAANVLANVFACLAACFLGWLAARWLLGG